MANVFDVAHFFVQVANLGADDQITNLKLNKLIYYAQGVCIARTGRPLFDKEIYAWDLGPVVPCIYQKYKKYGKSPIPLDFDFDRACFEPNELEVLLDVMREFGQYTGAALVFKTHMPETPWSQAKAEKRTILTQQSLRHYFTKHPVPYLKDKITSEVVEKLPHEWYDPEEDAEWEAYL